MEAFPLAEKYRNPVMILGDGLIGQMLEPVSFPEHLKTMPPNNDSWATNGMAEIIHAANRGEKFTTIFVNNAVYGMTGGQMAPTSMPGQRTTTSSLGRDVETVGCR